MNFEYMRTESYLDSIDIEDIGNCFINVINDSAEEWYMRIDTSLGFTNVTTFGPMVVDSDDISNVYSYNNFCMEYNEKKIYKVIRDFINNPKRDITQVMEVDEEFFKSRKNIFIENLKRA